MHGHCKDFVFILEDNGEPFEGFETKSHIMWLGLNRTSPVRRKLGAETERPAMP